MAKPNYAFEKRQRDLAKKARQEAKRQRKTGAPEDSQDTDRTDPAPPTTDAGTDSRGLA